MILSEIIRSVISENPSRAAVRELVLLFHRIAIAYLQKKSRAGSLDPAIFGIPLEDVAFDCIAGLFRRDANGVFVILTKYYSTADLGVTGESGVLGLSRRLVFSRVNQELYRQYVEVDPSLHKLIRVLKETKPSELFSVQSLNDEWWILFARDDNDLLTLMPPEILEGHLTQSLCSTSDIREILEASAHMFERQTLHKRAYPVVGFALVLRSAFVRVGYGSEEAEIADPALSREEISKQIAMTLFSVKKRMRNAYVGKGKVTEDVYDKYFCAISDMLEAQYIHNDGAGKSYHNYLSAHISPLNMDAYRSNHRTYLEYLAKISKEEFFDDIRKDL
jgi:hypothetical protein